MHNDSGKHKRMKYIKVEWRICNGTNTTVGNATSNQHTTWKATVYNFFLTILKQSVPTIIISSDLHAKIKKNKALEKIKWIHASN